MKIKIHTLQYLNKEVLIWIFVEIVPNSIYTRGTQIISEVGPVCDDTIVGCPGASPREILEFWSLKWYFLYFEGCFEENITVL